MVVKVWRCPVHGPVVTAILMETVVRCCSICRHPLEVVEYGAENPPKAGVRLK